MSDGQRGGRSDGSCCRKRVGMGLSCGNGRCKRAGGRSGTAADAFVTPVEKVLRSKEGNLIPK